MSNIQPRGGINAALAKVDYSAPLQAEMATGPNAAQAKLQDNIRRIDKANEFVTEFKQNQEEKKLNKQATQYLSGLLQQSPQLQQAIAVDPFNDKEIGTFIDAMGGAQKTMESVSELNTTIMETQAEQQSDMIAATREQFLGNAISNINNFSIPGVETQGEAISYLQGQGFQLPEIDKYKTLIKLPSYSDDAAPVADLKEYGELLEAVKLDKRLTVDQRKGIIKRNGKEILPGSEAYEEIKAAYPGGIKYLESIRQGREDLVSRSPRNPEPNKTGELNLEAARSIVNSQQ
tara:strand:+ start:1685 stop:2554 length:870 start_codon:yes stop_codon:yes gene_type:complete